MMEKFYPDEYLDSTYEIDFDELYALGQQQSQQERKDIYGYDRYDGEFYREPQCVCEIAVGKCPPVVVKSAPFCVAHRGKFAERQPYSHDKGDNERHYKRRKGRQDEQGKISRKIFLHCKISFR